MTDTKRALISNYALNIVSGTLDEKEIHATAERIYELSMRPDWTPCTEGLPTPQKPTRENCYGKGLNEYLLQMQHDIVKDMTTVRAAYLEDEEGSAAWYSLEYPVYCKAKIDAWFTPFAWQPMPKPYNPDHIRDTTKKVEGAPTVHDKKAPPAKWCCGKPPIARYHESEIGLSRACHTIKCQVCHSGVQVDIENYTDEAYDAAFKHAVELWNEKVQHRPPMNSEICIPRTEENE